MAEERLQKIIAAAGVTSRRKAEELITQGAVQVNGALVTELGTKADLARDHIRVNGKLLQGAERHRYYMLNKPRGYVTTVSDPEKRPTVMEFFERLKNAGRVYPVGRLDYLSEGLLLMTNDGSLANLLTKASTQVEKTYLVKVSGKPTEEALEQLRTGVMIEKGRYGSREGRVRTAPVQIKLIREGENPWYEMVLIEGRNRELRKMFEEVGHHVEKIRRVGFGPLVLDLPPGELRELDEQEIAALDRVTRKRPVKKAPETEAHASSAVPSPAPPRFASERPIGKGPAKLPKAVSIKRTGGVARPGATSSAKKYGAAPRTFSRPGASRPKPSTPKSGPRGR
jgi:23S rRNA pseudouridine2605 synthase